MRSSSHVSRPLQKRQLGAKKDSGSFNDCEPVSDNCIGLKVSMNLKESQNG